MAALQYEVTTRTRDVFAEVQFPYQERCDNAGHMTAGSRRCTWQKSNSHHCLNKSRWITAAGSLHLIGFSCERKETSHADWMTQDDQEVATCAISETWNMEERYYEIDSPPHSMAVELYVYVCLFARMLGVYYSSCPKSPDFHVSPT